MQPFLSSKDIGRILRQLRLRAGFTQEELAERVGVTFQQIQKYENGSNKLSSDKLQAVASALEVKVSALFDECIESIPLSDEERKLLQDFRRISDTKIRESLQKIAQVSAENKL